MKLKKLKFSRLTSHHGLQKRYLNGHSGTGTRPTLTKFRGVNVDAFGRRYVDRKCRVIGGTARIDKTKH